MQEIFECLARLHRAQNPGAKSTNPTLHIPTQLLWSKILKRTGKARTARDMNHNLPLVLVISSGAKRLVCGDTGLVDNKSRVEVIGRIDDEIIVLYELESIAYIKSLEIPLDSDVWIHSLEFSLSGAHLGTIEE